MHGRWCIPFIFCFYYINIWILTFIFYSLSPQIYRYHLGRRHRHKSIKIRKFSAILARECFDNQYRHHDDLGAFSLLGPDYNVNNFTPPPVTISFQNTQQDANSQSVVPMTQDMSCGESVCVSTQVPDRVIPHNMAECLYTQDKLRNGRRSKVQCVVCRDDSIEFRSIYRCTVCGVSICQDGQGGRNCFSRHRDTQRQKEIRTFHHLRTTDTE